MRYTYEGRSVTCIESSNIPSQHSHQSTEFPLYLPTHGIITIPATKPVSCFPAYQLIRTETQWRISSWACSRKCWRGEGAVPSLPEYFPSYLASPRTITSPNPTPILRMRIQRFARTNAVEYVYVCEVSIITQSPGQ